MPHKPDWTITIQLGEWDELFCLMTMSDQRKRHKYFQGCQKPPLSYTSLCSLCWVVSEKVSVLFYQTCPETNMPIVCSKPEEETQMNVPIPHLNLICRFVTLLDPPVK